MAEFDFVVDTTPMAETVSSVSNHVTATTAAVVAMQTAVIASEKASAKKYATTWTQVSTALSVLSCL